MPLMCRSRQPQPGSVGVVGPFCGAASDDRTTLSPALAMCFGAGIDERTGNVVQVQPAVTVSIGDRQMGKTEKPELSYGNPADRGFHR